MLAAIMSTLLAYNIGLYSRKELDRQFSHELKILFIYFTSFYLLSRISIRRVSMSRAGLRIVDCLTSSLGLNILGVCFSFLLAISLYTVHDRYREGDRWLTDLLIIFHSVNQTKELTSEPIISGGGLQYCLSHTTVINDFSEQFEPVPANSPVMWERSISRYSSACSHCGC